MLLRYKVISQMASSKWKRRVLRKFSALGAKLYARPYARKARLSMKVRKNLFKIGVSVLNFC